jgi:hypothetical protein
MRGVKREIDWAQYDALMATARSRREVAKQMGLTESTLRSAELRRGEAPAVAAEVLPALSQDERQALAQAEQTIAAGLETFYAVGVAFLEIRDRRLYRETFPTFEAYCQERWGMGRSHAYRAMDYAGVVTHLREASPIGDTRATKVTRTTRARRPPPRLEIQEVLVGWLQQIPDAQAWEILMNLAADLQSGEMRAHLPDELSTRLYDAIEPLWERFPAPPKRPVSSRAQRWQEAVETLQRLKDEYEQWLENLPENFQMSRTAELLQDIVNLDLGDLDVEHPQGFGRD